MRKTFYGITSNNIPNNIKISKQLSMNIKNKNFSFNKENKEILNKFNNNSNNIKNDFFSLNIIFKYIFIDLI